MLSLRTVWAIVRLRRSCLDENNTLANLPLLIVIYSDALRLQFGILRTKLTNRRLKLHVFLLRLEQVRLKVLCRLKHGEGGFRRSLVSTLRQAIVETFGGTQDGASRG